MKTYTKLYESICSFENLLLAAKKAQKGKRFQECVGRFNANLEYELVRLQRELADKIYQPGGYREFIIYEPKLRMISAAPYRDRVVHHALCNVIAPLFERAFIFDSYANRVGKGSHAAILRYQQFARQNKLALKCDVKKYFPSIDLEILKTEVRCTIACPDTLWLIDRIIDGSNAQEPRRRSLHTGRAPQRLADRQFDQPVFCERLSQSLRSLRQRNAALQILSSLRGRFRRVGKR
jgi:retron-type reverse transcriptase